MEELVESAENTEFPAVFPVSSSRELKLVGWDGWRVVLAETETKWFCDIVTFCKVNNLVEGRQLFKHVLSITHFRILVKSKHSEDKGSV